MNKNVSSDDFEKVFKPHYEILDVPWSDLQVYVQRRNTCHRFSSGNDDGWSDIFTLYEIFGLNLYCLEKTIEQLTPDSLIIDIGAHKGYFSTYAAHYAGHIIALEPDQFNAFILKKNLTLNNISNVTVEKKAVTSQCGYNMLLRSSQSPAAHSFFSSELTNDAQSTQVECTSLSRIFEKYKIEKCDLIKMDCEGSEYEILLNTPISLLKSVNIFQIELHEYGVMKYKFEDVLSHLSACNFSVDTYASRDVAAKFRTCMVLAYQKK